MFPFIKDGDVITIAPLRPGAEPCVRTCGIGHVVAFINPMNQRLVVHRIIGRHKSGFLIMGDNTQRPVAEMVERDGILGRVVRIERGQHRVWLGLGPERYAIAVLSRAGMLLPVIARAEVLTRLLRRLYGALN